MKPYSIAKALGMTDLNSLISDVYQYDASCYSVVKANEGQYAYFEYMKAIKSSVENIFYRPLPGRTLPVCKMYLKKIPPSNISRDSTCLILNNLSLLGHVTVLRSMSSEILSAFNLNKVYIASVFEGTSHERNAWRSALEDSGFTCLSLACMDFVNRFLEIDKLINPRQYLWWGWPPGQWMGPLLAPHAKHKSISFKYDFPVAKFFESHHVGYGEKYASQINAECPVYGFSQKFSQDLIPSISLKKTTAHLSDRALHLKNRPLNNREIIHIGTLGRSEKIAQKDFLLAVLNILNSDIRTVFHWTGKDQRADINEFFISNNVFDRIKFHGWVQPFEYLKELDFYLDTFPFGTGETLVSAGYMGLNMAIMSSPYEANFSNLLENTEGASRIIFYTETDYVHHVLSSIQGRKVSIMPSDISKMFKASFLPRDAVLLAGSSDVSISRTLDL